MPIRKFENCKENNSQKIITAECECIGENGEDAYTKQKDSSKHGYFFMI